MFYKNLLLSLPEVRSPEKKGSIKNRLLWTFGIVVLYIFLATIPLYGISSETAQYFKTLEILIGAKFGTLLTLGVGPIITASIILQLLKGSGILKFKLDTYEGRFYYTGTAKLLAFFFIIIESYVFVKVGGITPTSADFFWIVVIQLLIGGFIVYYMDEVVKKWGFGSGLSLFIAVGIGQAVFLQLFSPLSSDGTLGWGFGGSEIAVGKIWAMIFYLSTGDVGSFLVQVLIPILTTIFLFFLIVFFQSINVYIPLSFGRIRGQTMKWPLNFFYSGVIPVILVSALLQNLSLLGRVINVEWIAQYDQNGNLIGGILREISVPQSLIQNLNPDLTNIFFYAIFFVGFCTMFAYLWVQTSGQDSRSVSNQILNSGLQIPGFRKDARIIEKVLDRYIIPLTILGGIGIGILAVFADVIGALTSGTGILLMIVIIYQFYQQLAKESTEDFSLLQKIMRK